MYIRCDIPFTGNNTIKEVFDSKYFHGRLTDEEASNLLKEEMTNTGKPYGYIWYLSVDEFFQDADLQGRIRGYHRDYERNSEFIPNFWVTGVVRLQQFDFWMRHDDQEGSRPSPAYFCFPNFRFSTLLFLFCAFWA